jgi:hypothetical protein
MTSGRTLWYISGNNGPENAISIVENARTKLNLNKIQIQNLIDVRVLKLEAGSSYVLEQALTDSSNDNSCTLTYF